MVQKKIGVFTGLLLLILLLGIVSAETCSIQSSCGPDYTVMKLSGIINAHGELWDQTNYDSFLCCDFIGTHVCDGANKIIGLSDTTNAHAEIPSLDNYGTDVCYGDFVCRGTTGTCDFGEMELMSLSADTNAHIGAFADYTTKICCSGVCETGYEYVAGNCEIEQVAYWANINEEYMSHTYVSAGDTIILMVLKNAKLDEGTTVSFEIYEDDEIFDDEIATKTATIDSSGYAVAEWAITQDDIDTAKDCVLGICLESEDELDFRFEVVDAAPPEPSGSLGITITECEGINYCRDYTEETECGTDACAIAEASVQANGYPDLICGIDGATQDSDGCDTWSNCVCSWTDGQCGPVQIEKREPDCPNEGDPSTIGTCFYYEDTNDNCDDGFLTYLWISNWAWDIDNIFDSNPDGDDYVEEPAGIWHFDSQRKYERCVDGSNSIVCPAQIQLPFFTLETLLATIIILGVIYWAWDLKKKKAPKKKTKRRKK